MLFPGIVLRLWYLSVLMQAPDFRALRQDLDVQDYHARLILTGEKNLRWDVIDPEIESTPYYRPPGYVYYLAAVYALTGGGYLAPRVMNMLLGIAAAVLFYLLARRMWGRTAGLLTAFLVSTYWGIIYYEGEINDPATFFILIAVLFLVLRAWLRRPGAARALLTGLLVGAYAIMRPNILLFGPFIAAWMLWWCWRTQRLRAMPGSWMALALGAACCVLPVTVRNYLVSGEFVPISTYYGENLLIGNGEGSDGVTSWTPYLQELEGTGNFSVWFYPNIVRGLGKEIGKPDLTHSEASKVFAKMAKDYLMEHKARTLALALRKAALFWSPQEITENKVVQGEKDFYPPLKYLPGFPFLAALFAGGTLWLLRDLLRRGAGRAVAGDAETRALLLLIYAFVAVYFLSFLPFFVNARARAPLFGLCLMAGAYGLSRWWAIFRERKWRACAGAGILFALLYAAASVDWVPYAPDMARWRYDRADSYLREGRIDEAWREAQAMLDLPGDPPSYMPYRLGHWFAHVRRHEEGYTLLKAALDINPATQHPRYREDLLYHTGRQALLLDRYDEASRLFDEARGINPEDPRILNDLGVIAERQGDLETAKRYYEQAVAVSQDFALGYANLGELEERAGNAAGALAFYEKAAAAAPDAPGHRYNAARMLAEMGRAEDAERTYREVIEAEPEEARARNNLGLLLESQQRFEEAAQQYRDAIHAVPEFGLPYANLANLLARAGDADGAIRLCRQGLAANEKDPVLHNALGFLLARTGAADEARGCYERAIELDPEYPLAHLNLGLLLEQAQDVEGARRAFQRVLELDPDNAAARARIGALDSAAGI